ncbi:MAG: transglycosylase SLT domain-containing protein [Gammaproteobacteria bacterium]|nr:transglycosylase SLT domain-containing protein [Gammaproteobacteria bacterium]
MLIFLLSAPVLASISPVEKQRLLFQQAENALSENDLKQFDDLLAKLHDYPVVAYLEYDALSLQLSHTNADDVKLFLNKHDDYPFRYALLSKWLDLLASRKDWAGYLDFYDGRSATRYKCLALTARLEVGQIADINQDIEKLWLTGYSQPDECDIPFQHFLQTGDDVYASVWTRIEKAFEARRPTLSTYLARNLSADDRKLVDEWYQAHRHPQQRLSVLADFPDTLINRKIIVHAIQRLARKNSLQAKQYWDQTRDSFQFSAQQVAQINKRIALSAAYQHKAESKELLEQLPVEQKSDNAHLWLARIYLRDEDWIGLIKTIEVMPEHLQKESEWVYWQARAYDKVGHHVKATETYRGLAQKGSYYGFLAADRIAVSYQINQQQAADEASFDENLLLAKSDHLLRARELFFLNRLLDARREWFQGIRKLSQLEIRQAASMASNWKWHDNAIKTVAKTSHRTDYDLRFPMPYRQLMVENVEQNGLDLSVIYGVMRRESLFDPLAKSKVGALGLMQLMPSTARHVAKSLGLKKPVQSDILNIDNNIRLGTSYFKSVLKRFDDNVSLATAAYNAGPGNVKKWLPEKESLPADLWVETVPFKETRNYIQAVLAYATIFDKHLGKEVNISSRMADVKPEY